MAAEGDLQVPPQRVVTHLLADKVTNMFPHFLHEFSARSDAVRVKESALIDNLSFACGFGNTLQSILRRSETSCALRQIYLMYVLGRKILKVTIDTCWFNLARGATPSIAIKSTFFGFTISVTIRSI